MLALQECEFDNIAAINTFVYLDNNGILRQQTTAPTRTDFIVNYS
jgi:hypothetical protein